MSFSQKDWIFLSDGHFTGRDPKRMEVFLSFLYSESHRMSHLVILGDLFEFFFGFDDSSLEKDFFPFSDYLPVLNGLKDLYHQGVQIKYFEGNHDFFINSFFLRQFGIVVEVYPEWSEERLGGKRAFISHGDLSNPGLWRYRIFRRMIKNPLTYRLIQVCGPRLSRRIAEMICRVSYQKYHIDIPAGPPPAFRSFAHQKFLEGYEIVILGHSHFPEEVEEFVGGKKCLYFNVGDWITQLSFLRFTPPDRFELCHWERG